MKEMKLIKTIPIDKDIYKDMKNLIDFYVMTGLTKILMDDFGNEYLDPLIDVTCVGMNSEDCNELKTIMFDNNYRKEKYRRYNKKNLSQAIGWEMLYYAPYSVDPAFTGKEDPHEHGLLYLYEGWNQGKKN